MCVCVCVCVYLPGDAQSQMNTDEHHRSKRREHRTLAEHVDSEPKQWREDDRHEVGDAHKVIGLFFCSIHLLAVLRRHVELGHTRVCVALAPNPQLVGASVALGSTPLHWIQSIVELGVPVAVVANEIKR